ncbi:MAG TPA: alpha/beta fold hydrolase [Chitinophagaceae bacterium]
MKKILLRTLKLLIAFYILICIVLFFFQEKMIFFPEKLEKGFKFSFSGTFEEINIQTGDHKLLNGLLFKSDSSQGLIFYLHGNAGSLNSWGRVASTYTNMNYDIFLLDYRGYGKSEGSISGQEQFFGDIQTVYNEMKKRYSEDKIIVLGYSIGTGLASKVASVNNPRLLILQAPYYSLMDMMRKTYPIIPTFLLKYKFRTDKFISNCKMPIVIFHGDRDEVIYYNSSIKLKELLKRTDTVITLKGQGHNGMTDNPKYRTEIKRILSE